MDKSRINRVVVKEFDRLAYLTPLEMEILTTRAAGTIGGFGIPALDLNE